MDSCERPTNCASRESSSPQEGSGRCGCATTYVGTSSLMALPAEADFDTDIAAEIDQYMATDTANARDRARLFHLAWDASCSSFSGRQVLYERMFGGNPVRNALALYNNYDKEPFKQRVREFLDLDEPEL